MFDPLLDGIWWFSISNIKIADISANEVLYMASQFAQIIQQKDELNQVGPRKSRNLKEGFFFLRCAILFGHLKRNFWMLVTDKMSKIIDVICN